MQASATAATRAQGMRQECPRDRLHVLSSRPDCAGGLTPMLTAASVRRRVRSRHLGSAVAILWHYDLPRGG